MGDQTTTGLAKSWGELLPDGGMLPRHRENLSVAARLLPQALASPMGMMMLGPYAPAVCAVAIADGPEAVRPVLRGLRPVLERAASRCPAPLPALSNVGLLSLLAAAECCGELPEPLAGADAAGVLRLAVAERQGSTERERHAAAFAALGSGNGPLVGKILGFAPARDWAPGKGFGLDATGFLEYLAAAQKRGAAPEAVEPAYRDLVAGFPRKLGAGTLAWPDLMWAARAFHHLFGKRPAGEVAGEIHRLVTS